MPATLSGNAKPPQLRPGVQRAIAASENDGTLAIELELISVLEGPAFRGSLRSRAFLRFVVEEALAGRQDLMKERTIGIAVLNKPADYDTGADSSVRVRANDVRKRLAAHYDVTPPKGSVRLELPLGTYIPRFVSLSVPPAEQNPGVEQAPRPPAMRFWQLAAPTLVALFLALAAIRAGVESSDTFSRFWNQAMVGRTEIVVEVDALTAGQSIAPAMVDAALPFEMLSNALETPVHVLAAGRAHRANACVVRLSLTEKPPGRELFRLAGASVFRGGPDGEVLWLWAPNADALRSAAQVLTSRSGFPEVL